MLGKPPLWLVCIKHSLPDCQCFVVHLGKFTPIKTLKCFGLRSTYPNPSLCLCALNDVHKREVA